MKQYILSLTLAILCLSFFQKTANAQELNAQVTVESPKLQQADPRIFITLENDLREFLNGRKWTDDVFKVEEKINCNFSLVITEEISSSVFSAQLTIQSSRPILNSGYESVMFNHIDKQVKFEYVEFQPVQFNDNSFTSDLSSIFAFYAYMIIAYDYESFAPNGGDPLFVKAQNVVSNAQRSPIKGWKAMEDSRHQNRYWLVEDILNNQHKKLRQAYYQYHRSGLDLMNENVEQGRNAIWAAIQLLKTTNQVARMSMAVDVFVNTKKDEIISIFEHSSVSSPEKVRVMNAMASIDPSNIQQYSKINNVLDTGKGGRSGNDNSSNPFSTPSNNGFPSGKSNRGFN
ncbi:MAG: DUF4835 family protein [Chitinophagales bacterium]